MRTAYLFAVFANRGIALLCLLALSHLLPIDQFGVYALMGTNALLIETIFGSWLATAATRQLSIHGLDEQSHDLARIAILMAGIAFIEVALLMVTGAYMALAQGQALWPSLILIAAWSISMLFFDVTLAIKNAIGNDNGYLRVSLVRNLTAAMLSVLLVLAKFGPFGAVAGQIIGIIISLTASSSTFKLWRPILLVLRSSIPSLSFINEMLKFGFAGTLALGLFVLVNGIVRNGILVSSGQSAAGIFSLVSDLFFAPMTLFGTAYSLSKMRSMYQLQSAPLEFRLKEHRRFLATIGFLCVPYAVGGYWLAPDIAELILASETSREAAAIAGLSAFQSAIFSLLFAQITILLTMGEKRKVIWVALATLICYGIATKIASDFATLPAFMLASTLAAVIANFIAVAYVGLPSLPLRSYALTMLATSIMGLVLWLLSGLSFPGAVIVSVVVGGGSYLIAALVLKPIEWQELFPWFAPAPDSHTIAEV